MSRLTDLIAQAKAKDPQLGADLESEFRVLSERRPFGLNFERHQPEAVELPSRPVRKGDKVRVLPPRGTTAHGDPTLWRVTGFDGTGDTRTATLAPLTDRGPDQTDQTRAVPVADLVVVAEFRDPIYPGLVSTGRVERGGDKPFHTVINAENYHALQTLLFTHRGKVDCIYIDPPYATGKDDWIYNDRHVDADDLYRHSKWLAFMERRLRLARELLKDTGVIIVAIGDDQHHRLRLLMDQVFFEENFISNVAWQGGRKNDSRFVSNGADYMLIYARNTQAWIVEGFRVQDAPDVHSLTAAEIPLKGARWRVSKAGVERVLAQGARAWEEAAGDADAATKIMRAWFRALPKDAPERAMSRSVYFLPDGRLCRDDNITWPGGGGPDYDVLHPKTGKPVPVPERGWLFPTPARMQEAIDGGWVIFREDHTKPVSLKKPLDSVTGQVALSVFDRQRTHGSRHLHEAKKDTGVFAEKRFPNPKDHEVLMEWLRMCSPRDAVILDFFGGSGSTLEAVARLNHDDGGTRRCILVTNNEVGVQEDRALRKSGYRKGDDEWEAKGVFEYVTRPRLTTVLTGHRPDGKAYAKPVDANAEFFDLTYETPWRVARNRGFDVIAPLLWLRAGSVGRRIDAVPEQGWDVADAYGVLVNLDRAKQFVRAVTDAGGVGLVFVVTDDDRRFQMVCAELPETVEVVRLYESYLSNFEINTGRE